MFIAIIHAPPRRRAEEREPSWPFTRTLSPLLRTAPDVWVSASYKHETLGGVSRCKCPIRKIIGNVFWSLCG
jgi:hypothetical protein